MSVNNYKIRRKIVLNGQTHWVSGMTEQEYAENLLKLVGVNNIGNNLHIFKEYAESWYELFSKPNVSNATAISYKNQLNNHIYPIIGNMPLEDVKLMDIQRIFNSMDSGTKLSSKNKVKVVLNQIFKLACEEGIIDRNPMDSGTLKIRGGVSSITRPYSVSEMQYFVRHISDVKDPMARRWFALSVSLPFRPEEVLGLKWGDIDVTVPVAHIRNTVTHPTRNAPEFHAYTKTASSVRDLVFPVEIMKYLLPIGNKEHFVIGGEKPISYTRLRSICRSIEKDIGYLEKITPRRFRTTVATDISAMTHDLKLVQTMLGHSNPDMTLRHYDKGRSNAVDASKAIELCYGFKN